LYVQSGHDLKKKPLELKYFKEAGILDFLNCLFIFRLFRLSSSDCVALKIFAVGLSGEVW
jgi:hypothetical protein